MSLIVAGRGMETVPVVPVTPVVVGGDSLPTWSEREFDLNAFDRLLGGHIANFDGGIGIVNDGGDRRC